MHGVLSERSVPNLVSKSNSTQPIPCTRFVQRDLVVTDLMKTERYRTMCYFDVDAHKLHSLSASEDTNRPA